MEEEFNRPEFKCPSDGGRGKREGDEEEESGRVTANRGKNITDTYV